VGVLELEVRQTSNITAYKPTD